MKLPPARLSTSTRDDWLRRKIEDALDDPRPSVPAADVFKRLRSYHANHILKDIGED